MNKNQTITNSAEKNLLFVTNRPPIVMSKGKGVYLWDVDGNRYLDFIGGWAVNTLGHSPKIISKTVKKQSKRLLNASPSFYNEVMVEFAEKLISNSCMERVWFGNSGAEVNEGALKLARKYGALHKNGAHQVITTKNSFHGRTLSMMSATGKEQWQDLFSPKTPGFTHVPFNDIEAMRAAVTDQTIAIMLEPVQGEGGVHPATQEYMQQLRELCNQKNILLIFDEVQTGLGRTGKLFAYQHYGIEPDIMTLAKGIGGGFPLSALLAKERLNVFAAGEHGGTFGGQPLAMSVGLAVFNKVVSKNIAQQAKEKGEYLKQELTKIAPKLGLSNIRGMGLLIGADLANNNGAEVVAKCLSKGLIINSPRPNILRFIPPLTVSKKEIDKMISILQECVC